ncbi:MAG: hypothetical protein KY432_03240 [Acidobacteria bacterium]|nr:hypothetical protein [Acidobacteriota bacterium]
MNHRRALSAIFTAATLLTVVLATPALYASISDGDPHWANRAEGLRGTIAPTQPVDAAIEEYRKALEADSSDLEARWKLMRALRFKGAYVAESLDAKKDLFDEGRQIGAKGIALLEAQLRERGVNNPDKASPKEIARIAKEIPGAGELYLWDAINWGEWAQVYGKLAAVRKGAADRILREATLALEIDPAMQGAGAGRVLGRLHNQTPRVPFLTGWASDDEAVRFLRRSLALNPTDKVTMVFLAEALVAADRKSRPEAIALLKKVLETPNDPRFLVEGANAQKDARKLLDSWSR